MNILPSLIERFFTQRLIQQRDVSPHTVASYRDTFRLLLRFAHRKLRKAPSSLTLADLNAPFVIAFLDDLERERAISSATRNLRLTAIRAFFHFVAFDEPAYAGQAQQIMAIPGKIRPSGRSIFSIDRRSRRSLPHPTEQRGSADGIICCCFWRYRRDCDCLN